MTKKNLTALQHVSDPEFMFLIWKDMYSGANQKKRLVCGLDGQSIESFNKEAKKNIQHISSALRNSKFQPSKLKALPIPKTGGKLRIICVPTVTDRLVQRCILRFLNNKGYTLKNDISYGFISGYGKAVEAASQKACSIRKSYKYAYKADISSFFDKINRDTICALITKKVRPRSLHDLIKKFVHVEIQHDKSDGKLIKSQGIVHGVGLRQGMPLSPYLANLYLQDFDKAVIEKKIRMIRYADDLIAFSDSVDKCIEIHEFTKNQLSQVFLDVHDIDAAIKSKTVIAKPGDDIEFLGLTLTPDNDGYSIIISKQQIEAIKTKLFQLSKLDFCLENDIYLSNILSKIDSKIQGYMDAYSIVQNKIQLKDKLDSCRTKVLKQIFLQMNIDFDSLSVKGKQFLGLHL